MKISRRIRIAVRGFSIALLAVVTLVCSGGNLSALGSAYFYYYGGGATTCDLWNAAATATACGTGNAVRLLSGESTTVVKTQNKVRAYYKLPAGAYTKGGGTETAIPSKITGAMQVIIDGYNYCPAKTSGGAAMVDTARDGHWAKGDTVDVDGKNGIPDAGKAPITQFVVGSSVVYGYKGNLANNNNYCGNSATINVNKSNLQWADGLDGVFFVEVTANHCDKYGAGTTMSGCQTTTSNCRNNPNVCDGILNSFSLKEAGSYNFRMAQVGTDHGGAEGYAATLREQAPADTHGTLVSRFGSDCDVGPAENRHVSLSFFDLDFTPANQIHLSLKKIDSTGKVWWWHGTGGGAPSPSGWMTTPDHWDPPSNGSQTTNWTFTANGNDKFELYIGDVREILAQQLSTPFDGIYYEQSCGNLFDSTVTPSITLDSADSDVSPGDPVNFNAKVQNTSTNSGNLASANVKVWYDNTPSTSYTGVGQSLALGTAWPDATGTIGPGATKTNGPYTVAAPANYNYVCASLDISTTDPNTNLSPADGHASATCARVSFRPYVHIYGGDAAAGTSPKSGEVCSAANPSAGFLGWNDASAGWAGAGAQYAVQALGSIDGFASAADTNGGAAPPSGLAFANNVSGIGGQFGSVDGINCDYTSDITALKQTGSLTYAGNTNMTTASDTPIYRVNGNVYISGNVMYSQAGRTSFADIPSFRLVVVGGNIIIDHNVSQLDGTYVAEPDGTTGGMIYTCGIGGSPVLTSSPTYFTDCHTPLTINGSFIAKQVQFLRTSGDYKTPGAAAETFNYSPELWLGNLTSGTDTKAASITSLPPIL